MSTLRAGALRACAAYSRAFRTPGTGRSLGSNSSGGNARVVGGGSTDGQRHQQQHNRRDNGGGNNWSEQGLVFVRDLTWLLCVFHCLREYVAEPCLVRGPSMRPTIEHESWVLVNKVSGRACFCCERENSHARLAQSSPSKASLMIRRSQPCRFFIRTGSLCVARYLRCTWIAAAMYMPFVANLSAH